MSCNQDCNQGRNCDCKQTKTSDLIQAGIMGLVGGILLAVAYVMRTGGF